MSTTIIDIAKATGKSFSTVSRALSDNSRISEATKRIVREAAQRLGYHPSFAATALQKGRTGTLAVLLPEMGNPFYAEIIHHLQDEASRDGLDLVLFDYEYDPSREVKCLQKMLTGICDGVIAFLTSFFHTKKEVVRLWEARIPMVVPGVPDIEGFQPCYDSVMIDHTRTFREILEVLKKRKSRHIVMLQEQFPHNETGSIQKKMQTLHEELFRGSDAKLSFFHTIPGRNSPVQVGIESIQKILQQFPDTDAVFAKNGPQLYGMLAALRNSRKRIPEDLTLITCDDTWLTQYAPVPILAVNQRLDVVSHKVYSMLHERLSSRSWRCPRRDIVETCFCNYQPATPALPSDEGPGEKSSGNKKTGKRNHR